MQRKSISKRVRFEIFKRDEFACQYCGGTPPKAVLHIDHIHPVSKGGTNDHDNLVTACQACNSGKSNILLTSVPKSLKDQAAEIKEREEQLLGFHKIMEGKRLRVDEDAFRVARDLDILNDDGSVNRRDLVSIKNFISKLDFYSILDAAEIARAAQPWGRNSRFRYFCGICWNRIREND